MENKDDFLRFETGHVIKFINGKKELKESDFRTIETKKLYDFFSGEDGCLDVKDYKNLWNMAKEFANKNGNPELFDDDEKRALLEEINKNNEEKFKISTLNEFLLKVFQMPDKIELDDTAQLLNIPFHEMRETKLEDKANKEKEILSKKAQAEILFNPDNNKNIVENYVDNKLQSKTIADEDGNIIRAIFYDENGEVSRVEIKKEAGWVITNFKPDYGTHSIIKTGVDKNIPQTETVMFNSIVYKQIEYSTIEFYTEYTYSIDEDNKLHDITEYKSNKRTKTIWYNEEGQKCRTIEYIYSNDFYDGNLPAEIRTYNARGKLIETIDNKTNKTFDENGNEIKEENKSNENEIIADLLLKNFSTENLNLINKNNVLEVMHTYEVYTIKFDENANEYGREKLIDKILSNENLSKKKRAT